MDKNYINSFTYLVSDQKKYVPFLKKQIKAMCYINTLIKAGNEISARDVSMKFKLTVEQLEEIAGFMESTQTQVMSC